MQASRLFWIGIVGVGSFFAGAICAAFMPALVTLIGLGAGIVVAVFYAMKRKSATVPLHGLALLLTLGLCTASSANAQEQNICYRGWHEVPNDVVVMTTHRGWGDHAWSGETTPLRCCEPISAENEQCGERTTFECIANVEWTFGSHSIACAEDVRIHNKRCAATQEVREARAAVATIQNTPSGMPDAPSWRAMLFAARRRYEAALAHKRQVFEETERPRKRVVPTSDGSDVHRIRLNS